MNKYMIVLCKEWDGDKWKFEVCDDCYTDEADAIAKVKSLASEAEIKLKDIGVEYDFTSNDNSDYISVVAKDASYSYEYWVQDVYPTDKKGE